MQRPNIIALPTSQMQALCDVLGLGKEVQQSTGSMIEALQEVEWRGVKIGFKLDKMPADIVNARKARLGIA